MGLCEHCKKAQATFHMTEIHPDGELSTRDLCDRCAAEEGHFPAVKPSFSTQMLDTFISASKSGSSTKSNLVCENCGISYLEFRNQGLLGCPNDYEVFREVLVPLLARAHDGGKEHTGKTPKSLGITRTTQQEIQALKRKLAEAVAGEDYERAAELRDQIKSLETA